MKQLNPDLIVDLIMARKEHLRKIQQIDWVIEKLSREKTVRRGDVFLDVVKSGSTYETGLKHRLGMGRVSIIYKEALHQIQLGRKSTWPSIRKEADNALLDRFNKEGKKK